MNLIVYHFFSVNERVVGRLDVGTPARIFKHARGETFVFCEMTIQGQAKATQLYLI